MKAIFRIDVDTRSSKAIYVNRRLKRRFWFPTGWEFFGSFATLEEALVAVEDAKKFPIVIHSERQAP